MENQERILKVAIVGPESTGKSTLSEILAQHYQTVWVPEFARGYCAELSGPCTAEDELNMFKGQLALEAELLPAARRLIICDTTFLTVKIWSDYMLGKTQDEVLEALPLHTYDLYLLMDIDMPWEDDPLRDFPHLREYFLEVWHKELQDLNARYRLIGGDLEMRKKRAIECIDEILSEQAN